MSGAAQAEFAEARLAWQKFPSMQPLLRQRPLLDGCSHAYLDFGVNHASRIQALYRPNIPIAGLDYNHRFKAVPLPQGKFSVWFKDVPRSDICTIGFEPNQKWWTNKTGRNGNPRGLISLEHQYQAAGRRLMLFPAAISSINSVARFWNDCSTVSTCWGSSLMRLRPELQEAAELVPTVSLDWFLRAHVLAAVRVAKRPPKVYAKCDIEGAEFDALPPTIRSGTLCQSVDELQLERHIKALRVAREKFNLSSRAQLEQRNELGALLRQLRRSAPGGSKCRTRVDELTRRDMT